MGNERQIERFYPAPPGCHGGGRAVEKALERNLFPREIIRFNVLAAFIPMTKIHGQNYKRTALLKPLMPSVHPRPPLRHSLGGEGSSLVWVFAKC